MAYEDPSTGNTLTNLIPTLYCALDTVSRELVGFIPAVTRDACPARAAIGQTVYSFVTPAATASDVVAAPLPPDDGEQVMGTISMTIQKSRRVPVRWQGEESMQMNSAGGVGVSAIMVDQFAQAMRTLVNEIESDLAGLYVHASRAIVPAASTLFSGGFADAANVRKILADNGAPLSDLQMVIGTAEGAALRTLANLTRVSEAGTTSILRQGILLDILGFAIRESAQIKTPATVGSASSVTTATADKAVGDTSILLASAGTGDIKAGDLITIANTGDTTTQYVSTTTITGNAGTLLIAAPGLRKIITADTLALAVRAAGSRSMAFARSAIVLASRAPALPEGGDMATGSRIITDPLSGLSFEVREYRGYRQIQYEVSIAWGVKAVKEEHIAILAGA